MGVSASNFDERKSHLRVLAHRLFKVEERRPIYFEAYSRCSEPVCESNLSLDEAEELLRGWKLRGHGG